MLGPLNHIKNSLENHKSFPLGLYGLYCVYIKNDIRSLPVKVFNLHIHVTPHLFEGYNWI